MTVFTPEKLASEWKVSAATIRNMIRRGELRAVRIGRQYRILEDAVGEYLCSNSQSAGSRAGTSSRGQEQTESADASGYVLKHGRTQNARQ